MKILPEKDFANRFYGYLGDFPCVPGCTSCCQGVLSLTIPELLRLEPFLAGLRENKFGCPFRGEGGCLAYEARPLMCRLFGFQYLHPDLRTQPSCPKVRLLRPGDREADSYKEYLAFSETAGFVILGEPRVPDDLNRLVEDNRNMARRFPELIRFRAILTGGPRCFE